MQFEIYLCHGRRRLYRGTIEAPGSRTAAQAARRLYHYRRIAVRPEDSRDRCYVYRFPPHRY